MNSRLASEPTNFSVVLPCFNEVENIISLVEEIIQHVGADPALAAAYEILVVDDCSTDKTVDTVRQHFPGHTPPVRTIVHTQNYGQSAAICTGVEAAAYPWIVTLDGDGQNDPADIPALLRRLRTVYDQHPNSMICGQRVKRRDTWVRKLSSKIANKVRASLLRDATPDTGCGLKVFSKAAFQKFPRFDHMHRFLPALAQRDGGYVESVAVNHRPRQHGVSKYGVNNRLWVGLVDLCGVMWLQRRKFRGFDHEER